MVTGDEIEVFGPGAPFFSQSIEDMRSEDGERITQAPHAQQIVKIKMDKPAGRDYLIRKVK